MCFSDLCRTEYRVKCSGKQYSVLIFPLLLPLCWYEMHPRKWRLFCFTSLWLFSEIHRWFGKGTKPEIFYFFFYFMDVSVKSTVLQISDLYYNFTTNFSLLQGYLNFFKKPSVCAGRIKIIKARHPNTSTSEFLQLHHVKCNISFVVNYNFFFFFQNVCFISQNSSWTGLATWKNGKAVTILVWFNLEMHGLRFWLINLPYLALSTKY